jgi:hypothetical protein
MRNRWWLGATSWVAVGALLAAPASASNFPNSPWSVAVANPACDVVVTAADAATTLPLLNDPALRVFCVQAGDYRSFGQQNLNASGSESSPRYLRFDVADGAQTAIQRGTRARFESLRIRGSWWVVQGITVQPQNPETTWFVSIQGADRVVLDGNLIEGVDHANAAGQMGVQIRGYSGDPATHNTVQRNVIRNGNENAMPNDYFGVLVTTAYYWGEDNDDNAIVDNEIYDWGDGIAVGGYTSGCAGQGEAHGTIIDGNDVYLTDDKRIDCDTGEPSFDGACACAENGIDVKPDPGPDPADWTRITGNRVWGFRPTSASVICGGSGAIGQAITAGNDCPAHVLVAKNRVSESTVGIEMAGHDWIVAGNLLHAIRASNGDPFGSSALLPAPDATGLAIQWNTIVGADNAYDDGSGDTDTRCNAIVSANGLAGSWWPRGAGHVTEHNYLYDAPADNFAGPNPTFTSRGESQNGQLCYWRRRWTGPQQVCVDWAATTGASPHAAGDPSCDPAIAADLGIPTIGHPRRPAASGSCGFGAECAGLLGTLAWLRRRRRHESRRTGPTDWHRMGAGGSGCAGRSFGGSRVGRA